MRQYSLNKIARKPVQAGPGRPEKLIDWKIVDEHLEAGCPGMEVAAVIGVHEHTLYRRCEIEKQTNFSVYAQEKRAKGKASLRKVQHDLAVEGDKTLLIWLGKAVLEQREITDSNQNITKIVLGVSHDLASGRSIPTQALPDSCPKSLE